MIEKIPFMTRGKFSWGDIQHILNSEVEFIGGIRLEIDWMLNEHIIGILTTIFAPKNADEWVELYKNPPTRIPIEKMPDVSFKLPDKLGDTAYKPITRILQGAASENSIKKGTTWFMKEGEFQTLSKEGFEILRLAHRGIGNGSGSGHKGGPRGNKGFNSYRVDEGETLWQRLWANVVPEKEYKEIMIQDADKFLYSKNNLITSKSEEISAKDVNWKHVFFPQNINLEPDPKTIIKGTCDLLGIKGDCYRGVINPVSSYSYEGDHFHPLSPKRIFTNGKGIGWKDEDKNVYVNLHAPLDGSNGWFRPPVMQIWENHLAELVGKDPKNINVVGFGIRFPESGKIGATVELTLNTKYYHGEEIIPDEFSKQIPEFVATMNGNANKPFQSKRKVRGIRNALRSSTIRSTSDLMSRPEYWDVIRMMRNKLNKAGHLKMVKWLEDRMENHRMAAAIWVMCFLNEHSKKSILTGNEKLKKLLGNNSYISSGDLAKVTSSNLPQKKIGNSIELFEFILTWTGRSLAKWFAPEPPKEMLETGGGD